MKSFLFSVLAVVALSSCSDETATIPDGTTVPLTCRFSTGWEQSRSLVEGTTLGSEFVGITIGDNETSLGKYFGKPDNYYNLKYFTSGTSIDYKGIGLYKNVPTNVYAYYPYDENVTDITRISVHSSPAGPNDNRWYACDYLWGKSSKPVDGQNPVAQIAMKHALAAVKVVIKRNTYVETGTVNHTTISGNGFSNTATLNSLNGTLTGHSIERGILKSADSYIMPLKDQTPHTTPFIVIPNGVNAPLDFSVDIDGKVLTLTTQQSVTFQPGYMYTFTVNVNEDGAVIDTVIIKEWGYDNALHPTAMVNGKRVTILAPDGVAVQTDRTGTTLDITAINYLDESPISASCKEYTITPIPFEWGGVAGRGLNIKIAAPAMDGVITITKP